MKSSIVLKQKVFTPITIDITFESQNEFEIFLKTMSRNMQIPNYLYDSHTLDYNQKITLGGMMDEIHDTLVKTKDL